MTEAFAWEEPTATLTITPVEAPAEPVVEEPMPEPVVEGPGFDITLEPGLNMISIPLMPAEPYTAKIACRNAKRDGCNSTRCNHVSVLSVTRLLMKGMASALRGTRGISSIRLLEPHGKVHR